jgi:16S rRNA processing protein RimM
VNGHGAPLPVGRVTGFRGTRGEVTVRVVSGNAARWTHLRRAVLRGAGDADAVGSPREVVSARAYRDRLVLKFRGIDDPSAADALRGLEIAAVAEDVPALPSGVYWIDRLIGALVQDAAGRALGRVEDVIETGGADLLIVREPAGGEILVPLAQEIVTEIDLQAGTIRVRLPEGLLDVNAEGSGR